MTEAKITQKKKEIKNVANLKRKVELLIIKHLREAVGLTFSEIGQEFTKSRAWAHSQYLKAIKEFQNSKDE
ncbi:MAG: hypothetical protein ABIN00_08140 [candidate division WOR-3 bacterium]